MIRKIEILFNDETGKCDCENKGNFHDQEMVGIFETLKHVYLSKLIKKAEYSPNVVGNDFDPNIEEKK